MYSYSNYTFLVTREFIKDCSYYSLVKLSGHLFLAGVYLMYSKTAAIPISANSNTTPTITSPMISPVFPQLSTEGVGGVVVVGGGDVLTWARISRAKITITSLDISKSVTGAIHKE